MNSTDQEREAFEAEACKQLGYTPISIASRRKGDGYDDPALTMALVMWKANAQQPASVTVPEGYALVPRDLLQLIDQSWRIPNGHPKKVSESAEEMIAGGIAQVRALLDAAPHPVSGEQFQAQVLPWLLDCFGQVIADDKTERNHRFLEEALELVQACGCTEDEAHKLVSYVYGRAVGERSQEVGGVMVTLAALCLAQRLDMHQCGETELARITQPAMVEKIREKQKRKPAMSPLPGTYGDREQFTAPPAVLDGLVKPLIEARQVLATALKSSAPDWFKTEADIASHHTIKKIDAALAAHRAQQGDHVADVRNMVGERQQ